MQSTLRRILKDLLNKNKKNNISNSLKEGMNILGVDENDVGEFVEGNNEYTILNSKINDLLNDKNNFNGENVFQLYNSINNNFSSNNNNNVVSSFQQPYEIQGTDNNLNEYIYDNNNYNENNIYNYKNLIK